MARIKATARKIRDAYIEGAKPKPISPKWQRRRDMLLNAIPNLVLFALSVWFAWYEFGDGVIDAPAFAFLIGVWGYVGLRIFLKRWQSADQLGTDEKLDVVISKLDEFITEMKNGRNT